MQHSTNVKDAITQRRAARAFRSDSIPESILQQILQLGVQSPSGYNLQPWRFIVVREQANKDKLKACAFNQQQVGEAPVGLICCGSRRVSEMDNIEAVISLGQAAGAMNENYANYMRSRSVRCAQSQILPFFENHPSFGVIEAWTNRHTMC